MLGLITLSHKKDKLNVNSQQVQLNNERNACCITHWILHLFKLSLFKYNDDSCIFSSLNIFMVSAEELRWGFTNKAQICICLRVIQSSNDSSWGTPRNHQPGTEAVISSQSTWGIKAVPLRVRAPCWRTCETVLMEELGWWPVGWEEDQGDWWVYLSLLFASPSLSE